MMSIMRANCIPFPVSPRNSAAAVAHLMSKVHVKYLFVGREQAMIDLATNALEILVKESSSATPPTVTPVPIFEDLFLSEQAMDDDVIPYRRKPDDIAIYLHSSGSTAFPKVLS
jgi:acyl-coenzyme A synthetase/AMP-(fatty) acid ligase